MGDRWAVGIELDSHTRNVLANDLGCAIMEDTDGREYLGHPALTGPLAPGEHAIVSLVDRLRAAASFSHPTVPRLVFLDIVRPVNDDGTLGPRSFRSKLEPAVFTVIWATGSTASRPMSRRALDLMKLDEGFEAAARRYARCGYDFRDLYIVFEDICDGAAGKPTKTSIHGIVKRGWADEKSLKRFTTVAHSHRHRPRVTGVTMEPKEARSFIGSLLASWVNWKVPK